MSAGTDLKPLVPVTAAELSAQLERILSGTLSEVLLPVDQHAAAQGLPTHADGRAAVVIATSGSTGKPKLVALSQAAMQAAVTASAQAIGSGRWVLALPSNYIAGVLVMLRSAAAGYPHIVYSKPHFDAAEFVALVTDIPAGTPLYTSLVPVQLQRLVAYAASNSAAQRQLARFATILVGGQRLDPHISQQAIDQGMRIVTTYGASETAGGCCYDGIPIGDGEVTILDDRLAIATSSAALGYVQPDGSIDDSAFANHAGRRWFMTSDRGTVVEGKVTVLGRVDSIINRGGIKLDLAEVESWLAATTGAEAIAIPIPDATWGQGYVVVVPADAPGGQHSAPASDLDDRLVAVFGKHAKPAAVVQLVIPRLYSGKPDRRQLAEILRGYDVTHD